MRVFLCVPSLKDEDVEPRRNYLSMMLHVLRIKANIVCVPCEDQPGLFERSTSSTEGAVGGGNVGVDLSDVYFSS